MPSGVTVYDECLAASRQHVTDALETAGKKELAKQRNITMLYGTFLISRGHWHAVFRWWYVFKHIIPKSLSSAAKTQMGLKRRQLQQLHCLIREVMEIIFRKLKCQWCYQLPYTMSPQVAYQKISESTFSTKVFCAVLHIGKITAYFFFLGGKIVVFTTEGKYGIFWKTWNCLVLHLAYIDITEIFIFYVFKRETKGIRVRFTF